MKKSIFSILIVLALVFVSIVPVLAEGQAVVSVGEAVISQDGTVDVPINITNTAAALKEGDLGLAGISVYFEFDDTRFICTEKYGFPQGALGSGGAVLLNVLTLRKNTVAFAYGDISMSNNLIKTDGTICTIQFKVREGIILNAEKFPLKIFTDEGHVSQATKIATLPKKGLIDVAAGDIKFEGGAIVSDKVIDMLTNNCVMLQLNNKNSFVSGQKKVLDVPAQSVEGRTLLPVRFIAEAVGMEVMWDAQTSTATLKNDTKLVTIVIGQRSFTVNQKPVAIDVAAQIVEGRTLLPLRAIVEALGKKVYWNDSQKLIVIANDTPLLTQAIADDFANKLK